MNTYHALFWQWFREIFPDAAHEYHPMFVLFLAPSLSERTLRITLANITRLFICSTEGWELSDPRESARARVDDLLETSVRLLLIAFFAFPSSSYFSNCFLEHIPAELDLIM